MIIFKKVKWKNFLSYGNRITELDLQKSKTSLISAVNGSGKSTILDVISFALYGKPYRNIKKNQITNSINDKNCLVELEFVTGGDEYRIVRGLKPSIFEIYKNNILINQNSNNRDYQKYLEQSILKLNIKSFNQIVILGSAKHLPFMQLPTSHRREIIEDMLDLTIFSKMVEVVKITSNMYKSEKNELSHKIELVARDIKNQLDKIKTLKSINDEKQKEKIEEYESLKNNIKSLVTTLNENKVKITAMDERLVEKERIENSISKINRAIFTIDQRMKDNNKTVDFYNKNTSCPVCFQNIDDEVIRNEVPKIEKLNNIYDNSKTILKNKQETAKCIHDKLTKDYNKLNELIYTNKSIKSEIVKTKGRIDELQEVIKKNIDNKLIEVEIEKLRKFKTLHTVYSEKLEEININLKYYRVLFDLLRDDGLKSKIIKTYIPLINKLVNKYLNDMNFFVNFYLDENFDEVIKSRNRDVFSYNSFSEGEKLRIDLALLFTWREISRIRNSTNTNLIILDEITDSSLDEEGTKCFMKLLNNLPDEVHSFVISHNNDIEQLFNRNIKITKESNFSVIEEK